MKKGKLITGIVSLFLIAGMSLGFQHETKNAPEPNAEYVDVQTAINTQNVNSTVPVGSTLAVHFLDVGQGDCTLLSCDGEYMLIDAGTNDSGTAIQLYLTKQGVKNLKYFIVTHDDSDHEGGADVIISKFSIDNIFMCAFPKDTKTHEDVLNAIKYRNYKWSTPKVGDTYTLGSASFTILAPNKIYTTPNNSSIALSITHGENTFLFTGDCETEAEADMLLSGLSLDADVYQVGHHGSNTSSSQEFLNAVTPEYAVISCGIDNTYGHPRAETLNKFRAMGIQVYRTDEQGSILCVSDGATLVWNAAPSTTWKAGEPIGSSTTKTQQSTTVQQPTTTAIEQPQVTSSTKVWLSATGSKYHSINNCGNMNPNKATQTTEEDAISKGKTKCSKCW